MSFLEYPEKYDRLNNIISFGLHKIIKKQAVKNVLGAAFGGAHKILVVCCGTGDISIEISNSAGFLGKVTGIDKSAGMLKIAKDKAKSIDNIEFMEGDALNLPFSDGEFDITFISFGLRNLPDFKKGLQEMKRVTKKGGLVVNLDMCRPEGLSKISHYFYLFAVVPVLGAVFYGDYKPYLYLANSIKKFMSQKELIGLFKEVCLEEVKAYDYFLGAIGQQIGRV